MVISIFVLVTSPWAYAEGASSGIEGSVSLAGGSPLNGSRSGVGNYAPPPPGSTRPPMSGVQGVPQGCLPPEFVPGSMTPPGVGEAVPTRPADAASQSSLAVSEAAPVGPPPADTLPCGAHPFSDVPAEYWASGQI